MTKYEIPKMIFGGTWSSYISHLDSWSLITRGVQSHSFYFASLVRVPGPCAKRNVAWLVHDMFGSSKNRLYGLTLQGYGKIQSYSMSETLDSDRRSSRRTRHVHSIATLKFQQITSKGLPLLAKQLRNDKTCLLRAWKDKRFFLTYLSWHRKPV